MWIKRDFLNNFNLEGCLEAIFLRGPRQVGKSSILLRLEPKSKTNLYLDDISVRQSAIKDPSFLIEQSKFPIMLDEAHLAPPLFYEIKKRIDESRRERLTSNKAKLKPAYFRLTGSNQLMIDSTVKETLAGRMNTFYIQGLSYHELINHDSNIKLSEVFFLGGFPELWVNKELNPIGYINEYISSFVEKDLALFAGVEKRNEFLLVLRMAAARVGELLNYQSFSSDCGVAGKTVKEWLSILEINNVIYILKPYFTNLNKRLIKMPKVYFLDMGLCTRLQSHQEESSILLTPQAGHLFENLVLSEIIKTKLNFQLEYELYFWRTKEKEEIDFVIIQKNRITLIEVKLGSISPNSFKTPETFKKGKNKIRKCVVVATGSPIKIDSETDCIPLDKLCDYLRT